MPSKVRVGIVDDHPAVVIGVVRIVNTQPDLSVAAAAGTVDELLQQADELDVVLLDLVLADLSTPTKNVRALERTGAHVVVYTTGDRPALVREAGRAGVAGMIRKSETPHALLCAIRSVMRGEVVATAEWAAALDADEEFVGAELTDREAQVLALYASGETADRVAAQLYITRDTVIDHVRRIRAKYAAVGRAAPTKVDLYRRAIEDGLVADSEPGID